MSGKHDYSAPPDNREAVDLFEKAMPVVANHLSPITVRFGHCVELPMDK
jgi:hypothetical protein